jgi:predicted nucleic acid-binding protein
MAGTRLVIANTTPLINFAEIDCLQVLGDLFGEITVPNLVRDELHAKRELFPRAAEAPEAAFVRVRQAGNRALVAALVRELHEGEAECIALALEVPGSLLLLDDVAAREAAEHHGLRFTGTVGCLRLAKDRGLIPTIGALLVELRRKARFWLAEDVVEEVLRDAGETPTP